MPEKNELAVVLTISDDTMEEMFIFDDIPIEEIKSYGDVVIALRNCSFAVKVENNIYSPKTTKTLCVFIQLLEDSAIACELCRNNTGKLFLHFATIKDESILSHAIFEESTDEYKDFFTDYCGDAIQNLLEKYDANPEFIPVGCCK